VAGGEGVEARDLITLVVDSVGAVVATDVIWDPYRLVDPGGEVVAAVSVSLHFQLAPDRLPGNEPRTPSDAAERGDRVAAEPLALLVAE
jgi:hypothetical protein